MKYAVELRATIKVNQGKNINASVAAEMDKKDDAQIGTMRAMIEEMIQGYSQQYPEIKMKSNDQPRAVKMVSEKQLGLLRYMLKSTNTSESDLCRRYSVHRLNELTMADARIAIQELKFDETFEKP